jgi:hypothetical protein
MPLAKVSIIAYFSDWECGAKVSGFTGNRMGFWCAL